MRRGLGVVGVLAAVWMLAGLAEAQPRGIPQRLDALERRVRVQGRRIAVLEGQLATLNQTVASLQGTVSAMSSRLAGLEYQLHWYSVAVDCDAGDSLAAALSAAPAAAPTVQVTVSGTCHEAIEIRRDHVSIAGQPGATIEAPPGSAWGIFVNGGQDTRVDQLTVRGAPTALHVRHAHFEGQGLHLMGGVSLVMGSTVRLYAPSEGVAVYEESSLAVFGCTISDAGYAGVRVEDSTFLASACDIERSGRFGVLAEHGASVTLDETQVTDSGETGVVAELGSAVLVQQPAWRNGVPVVSRIAGSPLGLRAADGASVRLGNVTIEGNADGVRLGDSSVVARDVFGELRVTGNSGLGVRCEPPPAVPQLVQIDAGSVFGNAGGDIACTGY